MFENVKQILILVIVILIVIAAMVLFGGMDVNIRKWDWNWERWRPFEREKDDEKKPWRPWRPFRDEEKTWQNEQDLERLPVTPDLPSPSRMMESKSSAAVIEGAK